jgi:hypothetical protein
MLDTIHQQEKFYQIKFLERELAQVNSKVKSEIEKETNLTLGLLKHTLFYFIYLFFNIHYLIQLTNYYIQY